MIATRYENYAGLTGQLPFVLHVGLERTSILSSKEQNWHDNIELQLCTGGSGTVLLNGKRYDFSVNDIAAVDSNMIHYTYTESSLTYACLIISTDFCRQMGINYDQLSFSPLIRDTDALNLFLELIHVYRDPETPFRVATLNKLLLELLICLGTNHLEEKDTSPKSKAFDAVKASITFLRNNYQRKLSLEDISKAVMFDRFALCREFKKVTGQTIFENLNQYRCLRAAEYIGNGCSVGEAATLCGFDNLSFFSKTFKKYMGTLPSRYKNTDR